MSEFGLWSMHIIMHIPANWVNRLTLLFLWNILYISERSFFKTYISERSDYDCWFFEKLIISIYNYLFFFPYKKYLFWKNLKPKIIYKAKNQTFKCAKTRPYHLLGLFHKKHTTRPSSSLKFAYFIPSNLISTPQFS